MSSSIIDKPVAADVLYGKIPECYNHPGNVFFRELVSNFMGRYVAASERKQKSEKSVFIMSIMEEIRSRGGRFLKPHMTQDARGGRGGGGGKQESSSLSPQQKQQQKQQGSPTTLITENEETNGSGQASAEQSNHSPRQRSSKTSTASRSYDALSMVQWVEVSKAEARQKISHCFRDQIKMINGKRGGGGGGGGGGGATTTTITAGAAAGAPSPPPRVPASSVDNGHPSLSTNRILLHGQENTKDQTVVANDARASGTGVCGKKKRNGRTSTSRKKTKTNEALSTSRSTAAAATTTTSNTTSSKPENFMMERLAELLKVHAPPSVVCSTTTAASSSCLLSSSSVIASPKKKIKTKDDPIMPPTFFCTNMSRPPGTMAITDDASSSSGRAVLEKPDTSRVVSHDEEGMEGHRPPPSHRGAGYTPNESEQHYSHYGFMTFPPYVDDGGGERRGVAAPPFPHDHFHQSTIQRWAVGKTTTTAKSRAAELSHDQQLHPPTLVPPQKGGVGVGVGVGGMYFGPSGAQQTTSKCLPLPSWNHGRNRELLKNRLNMDADMIEGRQEEGREEVTKNGSGSISCSSTSRASSGGTCIAPSVMMPSSSSQAYRHPRLPCSRQEEAEKRPSGAERSEIIPNLETRRREEGRQEPTRGCASSAICDNTTTSNHFLQETSSVSGARDRRMNMMSSPHDRNGVNRTTTIPSSSGRIMPRTQEGRVHHDTTLVGSNPADVTKTKKSTPSMNGSPSPRVVVCNHDSDTDLFSTQHSSSSSSSKNNIINGSTIDNGQEGVILGGQDACSHQKKNDCPSSQPKYRPRSPPSTTTIEEEEIVAAAAAVGGLLGLRGGGIKASDN